MIATDHGLTAWIYNNLIIQYLCYRIGFFALNVMLLNLVIVSYFIPCSLGNIYFYITHTYTQLTDNYTFINKITSLYMRYVQKVSDLSQGKIRLFIGRF